MTDYKADWAHILAHPRTVSLINLSVEEDLENQGDVTSDPIFPIEHQSRASLRVREKAVVCGLPLCEKIAERYSSELKWNALVSEGAQVEPGEVIAELEGPTRLLLQSERVILNFLMRLSGVATHTRSCVDQVIPGSKTQILDTRKTQPGYRWLDKMAVYVGGGANHRVGLYDMILIKDNHIAAAGSIEAAVRATREANPTLPLEIEVDTLEQLEQALQLAPNMILLDNFSDELVAQAMHIRGNRTALFEASGGITRDRIQSLSRIGVDRISIGALTHTIRPIDFGLDDPTPCSSTT